jgi:hypothetical protein
MDVAVRKQARPLNGNNAAGHTARVVILPKAIRTFECVRAQSSLDHLSEKEAKIIFAVAVCFFSLWNLIIGS